MNLNTSIHRHGTAPYRTVLVHGGPGGAGQLRAVADVLSRDRGVLELHQTRRSVRGQQEELAEQIRHSARRPVRLIGHSWGAWLACLFAADHGEWVEKLILVSAGPFEEHYTDSLNADRFQRLSPAEQQEWMRLSRPLERQERPDRWQRWLALTDKMDACDLLPQEDDPPEPQWDIFLAVWPEAQQLRRDGGLLEQAGRIQCPVVAIHGENDPHPVAGVAEPLQEVLSDFRMRTLPRCGHYPWRERYAREPFFAVLQEELR